MLEFQSEVLPNPGFGVVGFDRPKKAVIRVIIDGLYKRTSIQYSKLICYECRHINCFLDIYTIILIFNFWKSTSPPYIDSTSPLNGWIC